MFSDESFEEEIKHQEDVTEQVKEAASSIVKPKTLGQVLLELKERKRLEELALNGGEPDN